MSALFMRGTKDEFFTRLGIPYGLIMVEGYEPLFVFRLDTAICSLEKGVEHGILTSSEAEELRNSMAQAGVLPNVPALFAKIAEIKLPDGYKPTYTFKPCDDSDCLLNAHAHPHGYVYDGCGRCVGWGRVISLMDILIECHNTAGTVQFLDLVAVLQQAGALEGMAETEEVVVQRLEALLMGKGEEEGTSTEDEPADATPSAENSKPEGEEEGTSTEDEPADATPSAEDSKPEGEE